MSIHTAYSQVPVHNQFPEQSHTSFVPNSDSSPQVVSNTGSVFRVDSSSDSSPQVVSNTGSVFRVDSSSDQKIKDLFHKLLIKEWNLPGLSSQFDLKEQNSLYAPKPIFNQKIQGEINVIRQRMNKSKDDVAETPLPNLIVVGEPGVGKTMLVQDLCTNSGIGFIRLPSGAMESHLKAGTHINTLHAIFEVAERCLLPVYIIMDDGEQLVAKRPVSREKTTEQYVNKPIWIVDKERMSETILDRRIALVNAILEESGKGVRKIGIAITTNRPDVIDAAFGTRAQRLFIDVPGEQERKNIISTHLSKIFKHDLRVLSFFDARILAYMAKKTEGFTGRNIVKMLEDLYACVQIDEGDIREDTIDAAIIAVEKTIHPAQKGMFQSLMKKIQNMFKKQ